MDKDVLKEESFKDLEIDNSYKWDSRYILAIANELRDVLFALEIKREVQDKSIPQPPPPVFCASQQFRSVSRLFNRIFRMRKINNFLVGKYNLHMTVSSFLLRILVNFFRILNMFELVSGLKIETLACLCPLETKTTWKSVLEKLHLVIIDPRCTIRNFHINLSPSWCCFCQEGIGTTQHLLMGGIGSQLGISRRF